MRVNLALSIPSYKHATNDQDASLQKAYFVYVIEVVSNRYSINKRHQDEPELGQGRIHRLEKRYSEFLNLHNEVRRVILLCRT